MIAGGGRVGSETATHLADDGHTVVVVESHEAIDAVVFPEAVGAENATKQIHCRTEAVIRSAGDSPAEIIKRSVRQYTPAPIVVVRYRGVRKSLQDRPQYGVRSACKRFRTSLYR